MKLLAKNHNRTRSTNHKHANTKHWVPKVAKKEVKVLHATIIILVVIVLTVMGVRLLTSSQALSFTSETAKTATSFIDSEGVNVHSTYGGAYSNASTVASHVKQLGIRWVRDGSGGGGIQQGLYDAGIKTDLVLTSLSSSATTAAYNNAHAHAGSVVAVEGANEVEMFQGSNFSGACAQLASLYSKMKGDPTTKNIKVLSFSIAGTNLGSVDVAANKGCPNIASISDIANIHSYTGSRTPEESLPARYTSAVKYLGGSHGVAITETGFDTALKNAMSNPPITEAGQAVYMPRLYLFNFAYGVKMTSNYELVDEGNDQTNQEKTFGLFHNDWSPKPAATAIANMNSILSDTKSFTPGSLAYTFSSGADSTLQHLLLQKADGTFYLAVWRNTSVWDRSTKTTLNPGSSNLTVNFPSSVPITTYEPNVSANPTQGTVTATSKTISLGPNVVILRIGGGSVPTPTPTPPPATGKPDLVVTSASPVQAVAGSKATFIASVKNQGSVDIPAGTPVTAEFSLDGKVIGTSTAYTTGLAAGEAATVTLGAPVTVPAAGNHPLSVTVDKAAAISESNESNNTYSTTFVSTATVPTSGKPDLTVTLIKPSQADKNTPVVFTAIVKNAGTTATPANTLIGVAFSVDGAHVTMSTYDTSSLAPGQSVTLSANTGPNNSRFWTSVAGTHQLSAWVDDQNRIAESDETNNTSTITMSVNN